MLTYFCRWCLPSCAHSEVVKIFFYESSVCIVFVVADEIVAHDFPESKEFFEDSRVFSFLRLKFTTNFVSSLHNPKKNAARGDSILYI